MAAISLPASMVAIAASISVSISISIAVLVPIAISVPIAAPVVSVPTAVSISPPADRRPRQRLPHLPLPLPPSLLGGPLGLAIHTPGVGRRLLVPAVPSPAAAAVAATSIAAPVLLAAFGPALGGQSIQSQCTLSLSAAGTPTTAAAGRIRRGRSGGSHQTSSAASPAAAAGTEETAPRPLGKEGGQALGSSAEATAWSSAVPPAATAVALGTSS